jgi:cytochrome c-type biogenesis protein CcmH/NrfG
MPLSRKIAFNRAIVLILISGALFAALVRHVRSLGRRSAVDISSMDSTQVSPVGRSAADRIDEGWTGSRKCAECHAEIWETYQRHPMAQSAAPVVDAPIIEDYEQNAVFARPESRTYRVERTADHVWHHESMTDAQGEVIYDQAVEVHLAIGSGRRGKTYLIDWGGVLTASPISWYSEGKRWDLSPGYAPRTHPRWSRRAIDGCVQCHVGRLTIDVPNPNRFGNPLLLEAHIGCERCHGPGRDHVEWHESAEPLADVDPIVNPSRLDPAAREDVCYQCHLQGDRVLRYGKTDYDFRPGQRLEDVWTIFVKGASIESGDSTRAVSQVDQMRESVCFQKSAGRLGCISCHDPHTFPPPEEKREFINRRCNTCHERRTCTLPADDRNAEPASGSCVFCHMPTLPAKNVPHTSQTDHRIVRRVSSSPARAADAGSLFDHAESRLPVIDVQRARGLRQFRRMPRNADAPAAARLEVLLRPVLKRYPNDVPVLQALGTLCILQHREQEAKQHWLAVLELQPENERVLRQLAAYESEHGQFDAAIGYLKRYLDIDPSRADEHALLATFLWSDNRREEALEAAHISLRLDPRSMRQRQWLAQAYRESGRVAEADEQEQMIRRMQDR